MEKIEKTGENEVTVSTYYLDDKGKEIVVDIKLYGQHKIDEEYTKSHGDLDFWNNIDMVEYRNEKIEKYTKEVNKLNQIQDEMNKKSKKF